MFSDYTDNDAFVLSDVLRVPPQSNKVIGDKVLLREFTHPEKDFLLFLSAENRLSSHDKRI